ncbi:MAG: MobA/MobL family protein [Alphaproteobacteria bacterium]|nr:MobA/MobL family protein [Alphaproteobacteria bacterium]
MPIPLLKHHFCRRHNAGPKAHAHAAYLSGTKLDDGYGTTADFTPKGGILHAELWVPESAPKWAKDRGELWRRLEEREDLSTRPSQAILAHKFIGALPHELTFEENIRYVKDYVREQFTRRGYAADWAIHAPDPGSDSRNYHVHIMVPLRRFENGTWAKTKDRFPTNSPALSHFIQEKQGAFFELQNRYLRKNGIDARIIRQNGKWTVVEQAGLATKTSQPIYRDAAANRAWSASQSHSTAPAPGGLIITHHQIAATSQTSTGTASGKYAAQHTP